MIRLYLITITIVLMILTIAVGIIKPEINKPVRFTKNDFQITNTELAQEPDATHTAPVQTNKILNMDLSQNKLIEKIVETASPEAKQTIEIQKQTESIQNTTKNVKTETPKNTTKTVVPEIKETLKSEKVVKIPQSVKDIVNNKETTKPKSNENKVVKLPQIDPTQKPSEVQKAVEQFPENERPLTEQEEIIVWNIWRSNLQNQIMKDTSIGAPIGTAFKFSFTVDKKGRISNLRTWSVPSSYNSIAINYLRPLILSYQSQPILNFPLRTKRVITNVTGGFVISTQDKFSTPNDYSDVEKIKTLR